MDQDGEDLPLMANTSHMLVKHFALDLDVEFDSQTLSGSVVLFLQSTVTDDYSTSEAQPSEACGVRGSKSPAPHLNICSSHSSVKEATFPAIGERDTFEKCDHHGNRKQTSGITSSGKCCDTRNHGNADFVLVLDCCDLAVLKVEEVDVTAVSEKSIHLTQSSPGFQQQFLDSHEIPPELVGSPESRWKDKLVYYMQCSQAPGCGELIFDTESWSLQIRKPGVKIPCAFPSAIRIWYKTTANGRSVKWTKDQSGRSVC